MNGKNIHEMNAPADESPRLQLRLIEQRLKAERSKNQCVAALFVGVFGFVLAALERQSRTHATPWGELAVIAGLLVWAAAAAGLCLRWGALRHFVDWES